MSVVTASGGLEGIERAWNEALAGTPFESMTPREVLRSREIADAVIDRSPDQRRVAARC